MSAKDVAWPVLVCFGSEENMAAAALMNRKAYRKSLESGVPWVVHPATGRVLSWPGDPRFLSLSEGPGRFDLVLPDGAVMQPFGPAVPPEIDPDDRSAMDEGIGRDAESDDGSGVTESFDPEGGASGVIQKIVDVIAERRRSMPEGSYTTLLFEKGLDKIRKKAGEEAVELLLAREPKDVVYEAADLVYHLLVLLEASDLSWSDVLGELDRRHG